MARLIDADKLVALLNKKYGGDDINESVLYLVGAISGATTVDAELVRHGHWIEVQRIHEKDHTAICECSLCGDTVWVYDGQRAWNYCPNCGAKMDEEDSNDRQG